MDAPVVLDYPYQPRTRALLIGAPLFAAMALWLAQMARGNTEGLVLEGLIPLGPRAATVFLWGGAVLMGLGAGLALVLLAAVLRRPAHLLLTETELRVPRLLSGRLQVVRLAAVTRLDQLEVDRRRLLRIRHAGGQLTIMASMLPQPQAYERLVMELGQRVPARVWGAGFRRRG